MNDIRILGLDPGFANCGYAEIQLHPDREEVISLGVIRTKKSSAKKNILSTDDNFDRLQEIAKELKWMLDNRKQIKAICAESMSYPPNASAAAKMAMVWGVIATLSLTYSIPVLQVSPQRIKKAVCGNNDASKEDIETELIEMYSPRPDLLDGTPRSKREHAFDGLGAIVACLDNPVILMARKMIT